MFKNSWKYVSTVTLIGVIMISAFLSSKPMVTKATPSPYFSIEATVTQNPHYGYYGGYHAIWTAIATALADLNITLTIEQWDDFSWWDQVWDDGWNYTGDNPYSEAKEDEGGWDVTMLEWWLQPHALEPWFTSMVLNSMTPPLGGFNIHPWLNTRADTLLINGMLSHDANAREYYMWLWQEEFMHDPPIAEIYYPKVYEVMGSYMLGYDPTACWFYDVRHLDINETKFDEVVTNTARIAQGKDLVTYAISEEVWLWSPIFMETYTEEQMSALVYDTLYAWSLDYTPTEWHDLAGRVQPSWWDYIIVPDLAAGEPTVLDGGYRIRVPLRTGVQWSDGEPFNATDVKYTFDVALTPKAQNSGSGDFSWIITDVELVPDAGGVTDPYTGQGPIDPYLVDFILQYPIPVSDFKSVLSNDWGGSIVPWHSLKGEPFQALRSHNSSVYWDQMLPGTGPFTVTNYVVDDYIYLEKNPLYWGTSEGYGPHVSTFIMKWIPEAPLRLDALKDNTVDFGEYPTASVDDYIPLMNPAIWPNIRVFEYDYPASNGVWFNFDNRYLSNRYIRQAIAHAIPKQHIFENILTSWGIPTAYPGKAMVLPTQYYYDGTTQVHLFNDVLEPYEESLAKAKQYMLMWVYANSTLTPKTNPDPLELDPIVALGPVGDGDFSGEVDFDDFFVWWENAGTPPSSWPWSPGQDIDPDYNNDNSVTTRDFDVWRERYGYDYPFAGAR